MSTRATAIINQMRYPAACPPSNPKDDADSFYILYYGCPTASSMIHNKLYNALLYLHHTRALSSFEHSYHITSDDITGYRFDGASPRPVSPRRTGAVHDIILSHSQSKSIRQSINLHFRHSTSPCLPTSAPNSTQTPATLTHVAPNLVVFFHAGQETLRSSTTWLDSELLRKLGVPVLDIVDTPHYGAISSALRNPAEADVVNMLPAAVVGLTCFLKMEPCMMASKLTETLNGMRKDPKREAGAAHDTGVQEMGFEGAAGERGTHSNPWWDADIVTEVPRVFLHQELLGAAIAQTWVGNEDNIHSRVESNKHGVQPPAYETLRPQQQCQLEGLSDLEKGVVFADKEAYHPDVTAPLLGTVRTIPGWPRRLIGRDGRNLESSNDVRQAPLSFVLFICLSMLALRMVLLWVIWVE